MTKKRLVAMLGAAAMTVSAGALAQAVPGFYAGAEIGEGEVGSVDDTAFKILGGYQFHRNVAAEIAYSSLIDKGSTEVTALELVAVGSFPVANQLSILGKLGLANVDFQTRDKTELTFGFGLQYDVTPKLGARLQWQRYDSNPEVDLLSIGVLWRF